MTSDHTLVVQPRKLFGKKASRLRNQGLVIANVFGDGQESTAIQLDTQAFTRLYEQVGESGLLYLEIEGESKNRPTLIDEVQLHSVSGNVEHVSFRQVSLKEKVTAEVSIEIVGEVDISDAVMTVIRDTVEVEALPTDLPEKIEVDVTSLTEIGHSISMADLKIDASKVSLVLGDDQNPEEMPVVLIQEVKEEPVEEPEETEGEGEEAAEGEAAESGEEQVTDESSEPEGE